MWYLCFLNIFFPLSATTILQFNVEKMKAISASINKKNYIPIKNIYFKALICYTVSAIKTQLKLIKLNVPQM